ncbi:MAG: alanine--tRNA ligase, partial [Thermales bacterium]|nr:alanine--tRNA ligase [Thermales bacterium]
MDSIRWTYDFLTSPDYLGLDPRRLFVTVYRGSDKAERDIEAVNTWKEVFGESGIEADSGVEFDWSNPDDSAKYLYRITQRSGKDNWWGLPYKGPCGPCSEVYYLLDS